MSMPALRRVPAAGAVTGQQIFRVPMFGPARLHRTDLADHAVIGLLESHEFRREVNLHQIRTLDDLVDFLLYRILGHQTFPRRRLTEIGLRTGAADLTAAGDAFDLDEHVESSCSPRSRIACSIPHCRKISMVRTQQPRDFG